MIIPLVLGISLLAKLSPRISWIGNFAMAVLVGVGAAAAIGGALLGTLIPQAQAAMDAFDFRSAASGTNAFLSWSKGLSCCWAQSSRSHPSTSAQGVPRMALPNAIVSLR